VEAGARARAAQEKIENLQAEAAKVRDELVRAGATANKRYPHTFTL
jgi:hypothetical protein